MSRRLTVMLTVISAALLASCQKDSPPVAVNGATPRLPYRNWSIELTGPGLNRPTTFTAEQIGRMEMARLDNILMQRSHGPDTITSWRGPSVETLLAAAEIKPGPMLFTVTAADGWELNYTPAQLKSAIIAVQDGQGRWLAELDETCPLRLVPPDLTANYWLMNICRIKVEPLAGS
ncbi:MAG: hypothetical protein ABIG44_02195 [Planctomycetota bacterium]